MSKPLLILLAALAIGAAATVAATSAGAADEERYTVVLDNAFGLTEGSDLRSAGVVVGKVEKLSVQRSTARALARIVVTLPSFAGFHEDVFCEVKPQSLIGEYYMDCDPGRKPGPAPGTIPVEQTAGTIPPDLVLDIMRRPARERFGLILTELGIGLTGRGEDLQATLRRAVPALRETDKVLAILAANRRTLNQLTRDADTVLVGRARNRRDVGRFSYGVSVNDRDRFSIFRATEIDTNFNGGPYGTAFIEFRPRPSTSLTFDVDNLFNTTGERERLFFSPNRSTPEPFEFERRVRNRHVSFGLTLKQTFGGSNGNGGAVTPN